MRKILLLALIVSLTACSAISIKKSDVSGWKTYKDNSVDISFTYPEEMIMAKGNCDTFVLPVDDTERTDVINQKKTGLERGLTIKGLVFSYCLISKDALPNLNSLSEYLGTGQGIEDIVLSGKTAKFVKKEDDTSVSAQYYVELEPGSEILRIWYTTKEPKYFIIGKTIINSITFS